jgi:hypothetical protein
MQQPPDSPIHQRLRTVRRRITAAVLATFVAAWLAVAALGKSGATTTTSAAPATGTSSQSNDDAGPDPTSRTDDPSSDDPSSADSGSTQSGDPSTTQGRPPDPVTTSQS